MDVDRLLVLVERLVVAQQLEQLASACRRGPGREARWRRISNSVGVRLIRRVAALDAPALEVDEQVAVADDPAADRVGQVAVRRGAGAP